MQFTNGYIPPKLNKFHLISISAVLLKEKFEKENKQPEMPIQYYKKEYVKHLRENGLTTKDKYLSKLVKEFT